MRSNSQRQLRAMLRKNWLLKIRHPFTTCAEILLPTVVMLMLIAVRTQVDTQIHHVEPHIQKGTYVEVGKSDISPSFDSILMFLYMKGEHLAFVPDSNEIRSMMEFLSLNHPLLKMVGKMYKSELELESYIRSDLYGISDAARNLSNPKIRGAVVFHSQGPQIFDYSIRLNHTWAFSGFPDVKSIMDVNGPYLNDLELGFNIIPTLQYGYSGFLSLQKIVDSYIIHVSHNKRKNDFDLEHEEYPSVHSVGYQVPTNNSLMQLIPENIRITPFPTREYTDDEFQSIVKSVMGVLYLLGFLYTISRLISYPVFEKESKIKEGLLMMGLKNKIFYLSWFITYSIQFAVSSAIITACTMSTLFLYSDKTLVFTYFFIFGLSTVMLSFLISTFFSRAKTAVAVGTLSFLGAFFPYYSVNEPAVPMIWKILASLLSPTAFALGTINFADYERAHVGVRWTNIWQASSGVNFLVCLVMMMFDTVLYCAIGLYSDKVLSRGTGLCYPSNFLSLKFFFGRKCLTEEDNYTEITESSEKTTFKPAFEAISFDMKQQELDGRCIQIRNLCKVFMSEKGKCTAVNSLDLTLYENQILALLGHNGAGKSTTISMLSGLLSPTSGDALVFGKNILTDMDDIRKILGVCPQNDILFPELTVKEHMEIYAVLKGVEEDSFSKKVTEMIEEVGLADKTNTIVGALSGGMKRKLSIGIALIGNSKVIILDEPTSGMDPYSMRSTWQLIRKMKKGRIILLTTHSMDEADILGDRIAIMGDGHLQCCGSSLFLKHRYGVGYTLTLAKTSTNNTVASDIVYRHVPMATCISDVGTEMSFKLPISSSSSFESMFREIESCIKRSKVHDEVHGIASYGISVTTLEEVFLKVAGQDIVDFDIINQPNTTQAKSKVVSEISNATLMKPSTSKLSCRIYAKFIGTICSTVGKTILFMFYKIYSFFAFVLAKLCSCGMITNSTFWRHSNALLIKRAISARRDRRTIVFQLLIPAVFLLFGLLFLRLKPHPDQYSMTLTTSYFNPLLTGGGGGPIPFNLSTRISQEVASCVKGGWIQKEEARAFKFPSPEKALANAIDAAGPTLGPILLSMSEYLITSLNESYQSRYGAVVMDDQNNDGSLGYTVFHNSSCQHAAPTYINVMNAAILRHATGDKNMTIQIRNHPLPMTMSQKSQRHDLDAFSGAIVVSIAFSFIPASFAVSIVKEREVKAKHQQLISGVSILSYWMSTYLWDFISFLFPTVLAVILFYIFGLSQFIGNGCLVTTIIIFLNYGLAIASSTYCLTFFFSDHTVAQNVILLLHFLSGLILMVLSFIMGLIEATKSANRVLKHIFRLSPSFCFADGLASLALRHQGIKLSSGSEILDWDVAGASVTYLFIESIVYFLLTIGLEFLPHPKLWISGVRHWWGHLFSSWDDISQNYYQPLPGSFDLYQLDDEDIDVKEERRKIVNGYADNALIYLHNLRKVFPGNHNNSAKVAVHSLTFAVQEGECFGFLGTNGAGKTTTLSMLTGEEYPSDGSAYIFGNNIRSDPKAARHHIGYCPQFDALLEFLTVREHLELYARIKAVPEINLDDVVNEKLTEFDLWRHADKPSVVLSGGNKRKLSVAIAMIGNPPIVILDEPSTGMDPVARRFMWDVISRLSTREGNTAVILTTHSMAEAQALCTRIGIMVSGKLRCIGSAQHLKSRFGNHLELEMKPTEINSVEVDNLCRKIQDTLFDVPCNTRGVFGDLEICIGGNESISTNSISEISLTKDMVVSAAHMLGNKVSVSALVSSSYITDGAFGEQLSEQLVRDGCIPLRIFSEWWLTKEKISRIDSFIQTSFHGATFHGCDGLNIKYQLPYGEGSSLADIFGHIEHNREELGIEEYSISQSTLETIFNHFAEMG